MDRFASLRYPVHTATQPLDKAFPDLFKHAEFKKLRMRKEGDWEKVVRYIVFLYDHASDLTFEYQSDLLARKEAAAIEAGFVREASNGKWSDALTEIMEIKDADVLSAIMCYLRIQKNDVWTDIVTTEQELEEFQELRMTSIKINKGEENDVFEAGKKKDFLMAACDKRVKHLKNRYAEFYADHKDVQTAEFEEMITPENAMRILSNTKPWQDVEPVIQTTETELVS